MTGSRCHRRKKMMGRCPDGGCGKDERPCRLVSRVPTWKLPVTGPETVEKNGKKLPSCDVDFFSQARKALCERSPFDVPEDGAGSTASAGARVNTLPSGLASLLKQSDSRKRHKKSHSGADKKSSRATERSKGRSIWVETEDYFRDLVLPDIDALYEVSFWSKSVASGKCFLIPNVGNEKNESKELEINVEDSDNNDVNLNSGNDKPDGNGVTDNSGNDSLDDGVGENSGNSDSNGNAVADNLRNVNSTGNVIAENLRNVNPNGNVVAENSGSGNTRMENLMEIDSVGAHRKSVECLQHEEGNVCSVSDLSNGLGWILGCRNRILLTSERPSKKRKLLGTDAGLDKVLTGSPCEGSSSLCDFCCKGDMGRDSNQLVVCSSCKVAVHRMCYGVRGDVDGSWLCCWCKHKTDGNDPVKLPCLLCPKQGGALKTVGVENGEPVLEFIHLFCALWMPEVYIGDVSKMDSVMNIGEMKETQKKLVCNVCKMKCGTCVRCSHGTCRTAFHPICAREARHRMEVWGKYGSDDVEMRAFCSKHSELSDASNTQPFVAVSSDPSIANHIPLTASTNKQQKLKMGQSGDKIALHTETADIYSDGSGDIEPTESGLFSSGINASVMPEQEDVEQVSVGVSHRSDNEDAKISDTVNFALVLKKLIDRRKVDMKDVALEIGVSPDALTSTLAEESMAPDLRRKIIEWLRNHAYIGNNLKVKLKSTILSKLEMGASDHSDAVTVSESDITDPVAVKSVPPRRRTKSNFRVLRDNKINFLEEVLSDNGIVMDDIKCDHLGSEEHGNTSQTSICDAAEKGSTILDGFKENLHKTEGSSDNHPDGILSGDVESSHASIPEQSNSINTEHENPAYLDVNTVLPDLVKMEGFSSFYVHPFIQKKLLQRHDGLHLKSRTQGFEGPKDGEICGSEDSCNVNVCCNHQNIHSKYNDMDNKSQKVNSDQLIEAKNLGILELCPEDEVEGELIYFQHRFLDNVIARKHLTDKLIGKVARSLPQEIDAARMQQWDAVLINRYLCELREAKKQGRKERRHKEAQAVLAAAAAAAAASSRISSLRKDNIEESAHQEKFNASNARAGVSSLLMNRVKERESRVAVPKIASEKYSDFVLSLSDFSKEHPRKCDICRRSETMLNPILVCSSCKVAVHLDCYRSVKESTGPWYCELCEDLLSKNSGAPLVNFWEKPYFVAECGLCGGTTGAFRRSTDGQWVHAFCAEWVFGPTFRRGQVNPVEGMDTATKGFDICCICHRKHGICIKCSYGHCQTAFHPSCARSAGLYMSVKTINGKLQHKAYCEKHGADQKMKAETQKHGAEELKSMKQIRVELERLRLLCERIIKREKLKRDLVLCSHSILACKRDHVARSVLVHSPFFRPDISSESATTSLKGNTDGYKTCSDPIQRSDDVTVDSTVSVKQRVRVTLSMDTDQRTDDSSTSQHLFTHKPTDRMPFGGKQIPQRASHASRNRSDDGEWSSNSRKLQRIETFEKELVMTSDQASVKNQQLPKGYFYIPVDCLPKERLINQDASSSGEPMGHDG